MNPSREKLQEWISDAREKTLQLVQDLSEEQLLGPQLDIVNPLLWEIGHVAWFQEKWVLRREKDAPSLRKDADQLYDSIAIPHDVRWSLPLYDREETIRYLLEVREAVLQRLNSRDLSPEELYFQLLALFHEDMHTEAFTYTHQTHGWKAPRFIEEALKRAQETLPRQTSEDIMGDVAIPGGEFPLGAHPQEERFIFDNEKWAHIVSLKPFYISRTPVTQGEFLQFVESGGYEERKYWDEEGWKWKCQEDAHHPVYWRKSKGEWERRVFDRWVPLEPHKPMIHVNWFEANAYCRWAHRRLPTEAEWEFAASWDPTLGRKRLYPWGDTPPTPEQGNLDWFYGDTVDVSLFPKGDSPYGCRQMIGNVWEWTSSPFLPYPGFVPDAYKEYSEPWFHTRKVLRGGCWCTRSRLINNFYRNFYTPDRRDVWAGFRTCALT
jgi:iron(II)-dependent oxidoreductase